MSKVVRPIQFDETRRRRRNQRAQARKRLKAEQENRLWWFMQRMLVSPGSVDTDCKSDWRDNAVSGACYWRHTPGQFISWVANDNAPSA